jgi:hypothetical protein
MGNADKNEARLEREWRSNVATVALWRGRGGREWRKLIRAERDVLLDICTYTSPRDMRWKRRLEADQKSITLEFRVCLVGISRNLRNYLFSIPFT